MDPAVTPTGASLSAGSQSSNKEDDWALALQAYLRPLSSFASEGSQVASTDFGYPLCTIASFRCPHSAPFIVLAELGYLERLIDELVLPDCVPAFTMSARIDLTRDRPRLSSLTCCFLVRHEGTCDALAVQVPL